MDVGCCEREREREKVIEYRENESEVYIELNAVGGRGREGERDGMIKCDVSDWVG